MTLSEVVAAVSIHLLIPVLGLVMFVLLIRFMHRTNVPDPPSVEYSGLFTIIGGWLLIVLTDLFWLWSGMASIGMGYLLIMAPIINHCYTRMAFTSPLSSLLVPPHGFHSESRLCGHGDYWVARLFSFP